MLLIVDVDETIVLICAKINYGAYMRAPHVIIITEHVIINNLGC